MLNVDAVLVLQRSDVACIEQQRDRFAGVPLLCIDPGILDAVVQAGLPDYQLRRLEVPASFSSRAYTQALTLANRVIHQTLMLADVLPLRRNHFAGFARQIAF